MFDLLIKNGTVFDGSGSAGRICDVAVKNGKIAAVGNSLGEAAKTIDASGKIVTPGWVDMHTHYDAQATWDPFVTPSGWHGCTTVVMGNCGVGFAPCRPEDRDWLIDVMEGVEDIPGSALVEGIKWNWETFPEYLDALEELPRTVDIAAQVPHSAVRGYVMGESGAENDDATPEQIAEMKRLTIEGLKAGALGFSTSRTPLHRSISGNLVAGTFAQQDELMAFGEAIAEAGHGVYELALEHIEVPNEIEWMREIAEKTNATTVFNLSQTWEKPNMWRQVLEQIDDAQANDIPLFAQSAGRAIGILMTWQGTAHPFATYPAFLTHTGNLETWDEKLAALKSPEVRAAILADEPVDFGEFANFITRSFDKMFLFSKYLDYEPTSDQSVIAAAKATGKSPQEIAYDALMENNGEGFLYFPLFNYGDGDLQATYLMHMHPHILMGLSDGGAHCGAICDAGMPTFMLTHWTRDRRGDKIPLEKIIHRQTQQTAEFYGLHDRGLLKTGYRADINVIDYEALSIGKPKMVFDLPAGGRRLVQKASGYVATICAGEIVLENDSFTEARPGKLVRGPQQTPV